MRSQSGGRNASASSQEENLSADGHLLNKVEVGAQITKKSANAHSAAGFGYRGSYGTNRKGSSYAMSGTNVNRSNSLHERKFHNPHTTDYIRGQQRLEPLVQRH